MDDLVEPTRSGKIARHRARWLLARSLFIIGAAFIQYGCDSPRRSATVARGGGPSVSASSLHDVMERAERMRASLDRGQAPDGVDAVVRETLEAVDDPRGAADESRALGTAARLLVSRYRLTHDRRDLARADGLFARAETAGGDGCAALEQRGESLLLAGEPDAARMHLGRYVQRCANNPALAHVRATLALLDRESPDGQFAGRRTAAAAPDGRIRRVVIDPGHGGNDPGAVSPWGLAESAVTLDVSRRLAEHLARSHGIEVMLTRDADRYVPLAARAARANTAGADLFISVHCNSADSPATRGVSTYVLDATSDVVAARVAARENGTARADSVTDPEVFRILADLRLVGGGSRSRRIAQRVQRSVVATLGRRYGDAVDLGVHLARFHVLVGARMPALLVELSFLSNPLDEARLRDPRYRDEIAGAIARAVAEPESGARP